MTRSSRSSCLLVRALGRLLAPALLAVVAALAFAHAAHAQTLTQIDIPGPVGSANFGEEITILPNGNFVVNDSLYDLPGADDVGAIHLYDGVTLELISTLTGSSAGDQVGEGGIAVLTNGNFVVASPMWTNDGTLYAGAATWVNGTTGLNGVVSAANSLVGTKFEDYVSLGGITPLTNGNYVVGSWQWDSPSAVNAGAATWGDGAEGTSGEVSAANSLVGGALADQISYNGIVALTNGNYVVVSQFWDNGGIPNTGAVTWADGDAPFVGEVSALNSLVGGTASDSVGGDGIVALPAGNFLVRSSQWDRGGIINAGALTWVNGETGLTGLVSDLNSLVGVSASDVVGAVEPTVLTNGNYVAITPGWDHGATSNVGAVTWGSGATGITGEVSAANSLIGSSGADMVGGEGVFALSNDNYVVSSTNWDFPGSANNAGAVTWGNGATGTTGVVGVSNSLVGSAHFDMVGYGGVVPLTNGNYVVVSPFWGASPLADLGAVTWANGDSGATTGIVGSTNSLVGTSADDQVGGWFGVTALSNGNYVVRSPGWDNVAAFAPDAGAATWGDGDTGIVGAITPANSLVGNNPSDGVGQGVTALSNGNYVVSSAIWRNGASSFAGAATWGNGATGITGIVSPSNSLVGTNAGDFVGVAVTPLANGNYLANSPTWGDGVTAQVGAVTWANGAAGITGVVSSANSLTGGSPQDFVGMLEDGAFPLASLVTALPNSEYVVQSPHHDGSGADTGALSLGSRRGSTSGAVSAANSVLGTIASGGAAIGWTFNSVHEWVAVSGHAANLVTVIFYKEALTVGKTGAGTGVVTSIPAAIDCGNTCTAEIQAGTVVTLTATADPSSTFTGWSGDCTGTGVCAVEMTQARNVTATFALKTYTLTVNTTGTGSGTVSGAPANPIAHGTVVTLTAAAATGSTFTGWGGDCSGSGVCVVTMTQARTVNATFTSTSSFHVLTVSVIGAGSGTVSGAPANPIAHGTVVTLTATANAGSLFGGWGGGCTGTALCVLTMNSAKSVSATFNLGGDGGVEVNITPTNEGGTVTVEVVTDTVAAAAVHAPVSIASTTETYPVGTVLRLTAQPFLGYVFDAWGGDASGTQNPLEVTVTGPLSITAAFAVADVYLPAVSTP